MAAGAGDRTTRTGAIAYLRTSTGDQELSPDAQLHAIQRWAAARGVEILEVYSDVDVSSQSPVGERPHLPMAIDAVRRLRAAYLVASVSDRFHRRGSVADEIRTLTAIAGGRVVTADGVEDGEDEGPSHWLVKRILELVVEYEVLMIRARTRAALDVRRRNGLVTGRIPLGYQDEVVGKTPSGKPIRALVVDPREREAAALALVLHARGLSLKAIGRELLQAGYDPRGERARAEKGWHPQTVKRLIERAPSLADPSEDRVIERAPGSADPSEDRVVSLPHESLLQRSTTS